MRTQQEWLMIGFALVALLCAVAAGVLTILRRRGPEPDGSTWEQSPAEPWGTIVLGVFFLAPFALQLGRILDVRLLPLVVLAGFATVIWVGVGGRDHLRMLKVSSETFEWRTPRGRRSVPLAEVVAVTDPSTGGGGVRIYLEDGTVLAVPSDEHALMVAGNLAAKIGQPFSDPSAADRTGEIGYVDPDLARFREPGQVTLVSSETSKVVHIPLGAVETVAPGELLALRSSGEARWFDPGQVREELELLMDLTSPPDRTAVERALSEAEHACRYRSGVAVVPPSDASRPAAPGQPPV